MIDTKIFKAEIRKLIEDGEIQKAIKKLMLVLESSEDAEESLMDLSLAKSRWKMYKRKVTRGIISPTDGELTENKIINSLQEINKEIKDNVIYSYYFKNFVFQTIQIVCRKKDRIKDMRKLFPKKYFKHTETPIYINDLLDFKVLEDADLIIYDNFPREDSVSMPPILENIIKESAAPILLFSPENISEIHEFYSSRVYFANSEFSIHSRINEMLLYLKYKEASEEGKTSDQKE